VIRRLAALAPVLAACAAPAPAPLPSPPPAATAPPARCTPPDRRAVLDAFVTSHRSAYTASIAKARAFLDGLEVDPAKLRAVHIKGKKKLAEAIDAYYKLWLVAPPEARATLLARVTELARPTQEERYHDLLTLGDRELKEDATSYLRVAVLLERMGVDTKRYREEIKKAQGRLDAQMSERGPHQRRAFHAYYQHFGLKEPFPLEGALDKGFIAGRADPDKLARLDVYAVTHEIYAAYDFGDRLDADPFSEADRTYLRGALPRLLGTWTEKHDVDLVAEIVTCMRYVRFTDEPAYLAGLDHLLATQNADGSWGSYESARARLGDYVKQGFYLHTTMVAIEALTVGFEDLYRKGEIPACSR
jgi:hypothetical protein